MVGGQRPGSDFDGRRLDEAVARNITGEKPRDFATQVFITAAGFVEESFARIRAAFERRVIQSFDLFPTIRLNQIDSRSIVCLCDAGVIEALFSIGRPR